MVVDTEELRDPILNLNKLMELSDTIAAAKVGLDLSSRICVAQNKIIEIAVKELIALANIKAIPVFFRQQILGTLQKIREVEMPS